MKYNQGDLQITTDRLIAIVRGFNAPLADQLANSVGAERSAWHYRLENMRAPSEPPATLRHTTDKANSAQD